MSKSLKFSFVCFLLLVSTLFAASPSFAEANESKDQKDIVEAKQYIKKNVPLLKEELSSLASESTLEEVEKTIQDFYNDKPSPDAINNPNIDISDIFPHLKEKKNGKNLNINKFLNEKKLADDESVFTFNTANSSVEVVVAETGDIVILERKTMPSEDVLQETTNGDLGIFALPYEYTSIDRATGVAYNAFGSRMFTVWVEGQFKYNGSDVQATYTDGDWNRHFWGSTLGISDRGMGKIRNYTISGYEYSEVYSRIYYSATFGVRWAGISMNSDTVEVFVGSTRTGNQYGGAVRP